MSTTHVVYLQTPIGQVEIRGSEAGVSAVNFVDVGRRPAVQKGPLPGPLVRCLAQLDEYFRGGRRAFSVPLDLAGTAFQQKVWQALLAVPYGATTTYGDIARAVGCPAGSRAVGGANHRNPVSVIVPCHRVVGSDGRLTGYGGGVWRKEWLLRHEGARP